MPGLWRFWLGSVLETSGDKKLIDIIIDPKYPALAADKAVEIAKNNERLAEILALDNRYQEYVCKALNIEQDDESPMNNFGANDTARAAGIKMAQEAAIRAASQKDKQILDSYKR